MRLMGDYRGEVPVLVDGRLAGVIWPQDVIKRYNAEVFKRDMAGNMAATVSQPGAVSRLSAAPGAVSEADWAGPASRLDQRSWN